MSGIETVLGDSLSWGSASTILDEKDATDIFTILNSQQDGLEELSNQFLNNGITYYTNGDYEEAAKAFEAAIAIDPDSDYNADATEYLSQTYLQLDETDKAIATYESAVQRDPDNADFRTALGQLYYSEERYEDAVVQYRKAVEIDDSSEHLYSCGEALLKVEDYEEAAEQFEKALEIDSEFYDALAEIGYAYTDMDDFDAAKEVLEELEDLYEDLAETLDNYIAQEENPEIAFAYATSTFPYQMASGYSVSAIDSYLENAGAELSVTMVFQFTKDMDISSVTNIANWSITRAEGDNVGETYNYGNEIPSTEISINYLPDYGIYDPDTYTATVGFTIKQNETADGTIDPSHIVFTFNGEDVYGVGMSDDADKYSGFSGVA